VYTCNQLLNVSAKVCLLCLDVYSRPERLVLVQHCTLLFHMTVCHFIVTANVKFTTACYSLTTTTAAATIHAL